MLKYTKTVIVIGGGLAGVECVKSLDQDINIILIESKDCYVMPYAIHRSFIEGGAKNNTSYQCLIPYDKIITGRGCVIRAQLLDIDTNNKSVKLILLGLENHNYSNQYINYDYLVIATGSNVSRMPFLTSNSIISMFTDVGNKINRCTTVAVVGCGPLGYEVLGELIDTYNNPRSSSSVDNYLETKEDKQINNQSIVKNKIIYFIGPNKSPIYYVSDLTKQRDCLEFSADTHIISDYLANYLETNKINRIESKVKNNPTEIKDWSQRIRFDEYLKLENGQDLKVDVAIYCTGSKPRNSFTIDSKPIDQYIEVNKYMKCTAFGRGDIYAIGDCCVIKDSPSIPKMGSFAMFMARLCANNINQYIKMQSEKELCKLDELKLEGTFMLNLGRNDGIGKIPTIKDNGVLSSKGVQAFKKDLGINLYGWRKLNYSNVPEEYKQINYVKDEAHIKLYIEKYKLNHDLYNSILFAI